MPIRIVSQRKGGITAKLDEQVILISRPYLFGNPYAFEDRQASITAYSAHLSRVISARIGPVYQGLLALQKRHQAGERLALSCWCAPMPCHGDVLKTVIEKGLTATNR